MTTLALQPDATAGKDAFLSSKQATRNYGTTTYISLGHNARDGYLVSRGLIYFDLSSLSGVTCTSATLALTEYSNRATNTRTFRVYRLKRAWGEGARTNFDAQTGECSWNCYAYPDTWATAGAFGETDCEQTDIGTCSFGNSESAGAVKEFSLTPSAIQEMFSGGSFTNNGFLIKADTESADGHWVYSSDYTTDTSLRPKLTVEYTEGGGSTVPVWLLQHRSIGIGLGGPHA